MKNIFYSLGLLMIFICASSCKNKTNPYQIKDQLSFDCPLKIDSATELFYTLKSINPNVIFFGVINNSDGQYLLSVSKYTADEPTSMDTAFFEYTAQEIPANSMGEYKILSADKYIKNNITYYRKISCSYERVSNVMFYLMRENKSKYMYELKMSGPINQKDFMIDILEKTVKSVDFESN